MTSRTGFTLAVIALGVLWTGLAAATQSAETFEGRLSRVPVDGRTRNEVTGIGSISATLTGSKLSIAGSFQGLQGPATAARLHRGLATGVRGSPIFDLTITGGNSGEIAGEVELSEEHVESLRNGRLYIQVDSESAPEGNLWGWLLGTGL